RRRHLNARSTLTTLLLLRTLPVSNDLYYSATTDIRVGDNDRLAARVAAMLGADTLVLLSDIDGLYTADPRGNPAAAFIPEVAELTPEIEAMAGVAPTGYSSGGMVTKLPAGKIATAAGCRMAIANGRRLHPLSAVDAGARCTWFLATVEPRTARKRWIAGSLKPAGRVTVDAGALKALNSGKSLLPAGVTAVEGNFDRGDAVVVCDPAGQEVARGLAAYAAADARRIMGHKSREIEAVLGYRGREELIHRDDLVVS
ncbi:MAG: glutamate 5-kinase, partial [Kiloniellaceae bacterium]